MKMKTTSLPSLAAWLLGVQLAAAQTTAFTYQGQLHNNADPVNGFYDFQFQVFDAAAPGTGVSYGSPNPNTATAVAVNNGLFTVNLDFGNGVFTGPGRWLEISVRTNGGGAFAKLSPRQKFTSAPYTIYAGNAASAAIANTATSATSFTGALAGNVTGLQNGTVVASVGGQTAANVAIGAIAANAATSANTANTIVKRDASGNFAAGAVSATSFSGNGAGLTSLNGANIQTGTVASGKLDPAMGVWTSSGASVYRAAGNVGIGTTTPGDRLSVKGGALSFEHPSNPVPYVGMDYDPVGDSLRIRANNSSNSLNTTLLTVQRTSGSVGIGTTTPEDALLDVEGDVRINLHDMFLAGGGDRNHGIGYRASAAGQGIDGPFVYGWNGGALGVSGPDFISLKWDYNGNVWVNSDLSTGTFNARGNADLNGVTRTLGGLVIENRTSDPPNPAPGRIWLRTDL
jgi:hypothetical protein